MGGGGTERGGGGLITFVAEVLHPHFLVQS